MTRPDLTDSEIALTDTIRLLEGDNELLAERAEEVLLIALIGETIGELEDVDQVIENVLERIAFLKDIPYCACLPLKTGAITPTHTYATFREHKQFSDRFSMTTELIETMKKEGHAVCDGDLHAQGLAIELAATEFNPRTVAMLPISYRGMQPSILVFADDAPDSQRLEKMMVMLQRVADMTASKIEVISLVGDLEDLNEELESQVQARTETLVSLNEELRVEIADHRKTEGQLNESRLKLEIKNRIANVFLASSDDTMYKDLLDITLDIMKSEFGYVSYINEDGDLVSPSLTRGIWDVCQMADKNIVFPRDQWSGLWGRSMKERRPLYANEGLVLPDGHVQITNALCVPILHQGDLIGQIAVANKTDGYSDIDMHDLEEITQYIAPILYARLTSEREEKVRKQAEQALLTSEERFKQMTEQAPFVFELYDKDGLQIDVNPAYEELWNFPKETTLNSFNVLNSQEVVDSGLMEYIHKAYSGEAAVPPEYRFDSRKEVDQGRPRWLKTRIYPLINKDGEVTNIVIMHEDITERKQAEQALKSLASTFTTLSGKEFFYKVSEHMAAALEVDYVFIGELLNTEGVVHVLGGSALGSPMELFQYDLADTPCDLVMGQSLCSYPEGIQAQFPKDQLLKDLGIEGYLGAPLFKSDGDALGIMVALHGQPLRNIKMAESLFQIFQDRITAELQRIRAEDELLKLRLGVERTNEAVFMTDVEGHITFINPAFENIYGYSASEVMGKTPRVLKSGLQSIDDYRLFWDTILSKKIFIGELKNKTKDGRVLNMASSANPILDADDKIIGYIAIQRDVTEQKKAEIALRESERKYRQVVNNVLDGLAIVNNTVIELANPALAKMLGTSLENIEGQPFESLIYPDDLDEVEEQYERLMSLDNEVAEYEVRLIQKDSKKTIDALLTARMVDFHEGEAAMILIRDITEKKQLEARNLRQQRMESLGAMAGGIAHDLNNVLAPVLLALELLRTKTIDEQGEHLLDTLESNIKRGGNIINQLLTFARGTEGEKSILQPKHFMREVVEMISETFPKNIIIDSHIPRFLWSVQGDATQLHQILLNLCVNARDAMLLGGRLAISAKNIQLDDDDVQSFAELQPGPYIKIEVGDTGHGIPKELLEQIFDPFFTTKEIGKGTGLGLATTQSIVKSHGGCIDVSSAINQGTRFFVYLPAYLDKNDGMEDMVQSYSPTGRGELILVVDDEAAIRDVTRSVLETFGYRVLTAADGSEGIRLYADHQDEIQLVITDMMMPNLDGAGIIQAINQMNANAKIILTSGMALHAESVASGKIRADEFLSKPYTADTLLDTVAAIIDS